MLVIVPKCREVQRFLDCCCKKVGENNSYVIYESKYGLELDRTSLAMSASEFLSFCKKVKVEAGFKRIFDDRLIIDVARKKVLTVMLSKDEYALLAKNAKQFGVKPSARARQIVMNLVWEYLEREKFKEAMGKQSLQ